MSDEIMNSCNKNDCHNDIACCVVVQMGNWRSEKMKSGVVAT